MGLLAKWIVILLLVVTISSCAATTSLHQWAFDSYPRTEVLGFVDGGGVGDALLVRIHGERLGPDGVYEIIVSSEQDGDVLGRVAPRRLAHEEEEMVRDLRDKPAALNRLLEPVDAYQHDAEGFHRIDDPSRSYYVSVVSEGAGTRVAVHVRQGTKRGAHSRGIAELPPPRREPSRVILGVIATPVAVAFDVVTAPVQFAVGMVLFGKGVAAWIGQMEVMQQLFGPMLVGSLGIAPVMLAVASSNPILLAALRSPQAATSASE